jgi:hypothetical protein
MSKKELLLWAKWISLRAQLALACIQSGAIKIFLRWQGILLVLFLICATGCASAPVKQPSIVSHAGIDASLALAQNAQKRASQQTDAIGRATNDPVLKRKADALQRTIEDLGMAIDEATGKVKWYEVQYQQLFDDNTATHKKLDAAIAYGNAEHTARISAAKRADVIIYAFAIAIGIAFCRAAARASVSPVSGWAGLVVPAFAFVAGFGAGYAFAFYLLTWLGQFIPDFSSWGHKI